MAEETRDLFASRSAVISDCGLYRYRLDRVWDDSRPPIYFGMLNPSTADEFVNDATIERCERRAIHLGFGSLTVWNLFAFRATAPEELKAQPNPIGPDNDFFVRAALVEAKARGGQVIAAWGSHGSWMNRHTQVLRIAAEMEVQLYCLGLTQAGHPRHPLYVSYSTPLLPLFH